MSNRKMTSGDDNPERMAFKLPEAATMLGVSDVTMRRLVSRGLLRPNKALRHLVFSRAELLRFLEDNQ